MSSAISLRSVSKKYRLYLERPHSLKQALLQRRFARYEEMWALRDVSLEIPAGRTYGLIGANGSGKSTLLRIAAGIQPATEGSVAVNGRVAAMLELGAGFHPELTGRENAFLSGSILGIDRKKIARSMDSIVEFSGLEDFIDVPVKVYSTGMFVRLGFSVSIHLEADILMVDEVISVGDEEFQRRALDHIDKLRGQGSTIVFVSHSLDLVRSLCDQVAWMDHGRVREEGTADEVVQQYLEATTVREDDLLQEPAAHPTPAQIAASIEKVELLGAEDRPIQSSRTHEPITVRLHYRVTGDLLDAIFAISLEDVNGVEVATHFSKGDESATRPLVEHGHVDFVVDDLRLLAGAYAVSAWVFDARSEALLAHAKKAQVLRVIAPQGVFDRGVVDLGGVWSAPERRDPTGPGSG